MGRPVASETSLPVELVAHSEWFARIPQYAMQNWTMSSFFLSCAIIAMFNFNTSLSYFSDIHSLAADTAGYPFILIKRIPRAVAH